MNEEIDDYFKYIVRYVDDFIVFYRDPIAVMKDLNKNYIMKGVGKSQY